MQLVWKKLEEQWRKELLSHARGLTLEPGIGTGINFKYYPAGVNVIGTDSSKQMIRLAAAAAQANNIEASFIIAPVQELELDPHSFDTVVSTFALGDYEDPTAVLNQFNEWCKPEGTVLLLEYGLSTNGVVRWFQKKWDPYQYRNSGTHFNRDLIEIISNSKLRLKKVDIKYAGMVYLVWATLGPVVQHNIINGQG